MNIVRLILISAVVCAAFALGSCGPEKHLEDKMQWHTYKEVEATFPKGPAPIFLYLSEEGCINCENMKKYVFSRPEVAWFLNTNYYSVKFDIVTDLPVTIGGKLYDRADFFRLFGEKVPSYYFFDSTGQVQGMFQSDLELRKFKQFLKYVHGGHFFKTPWVEFAKSEEAETDTVLGVF